MGDKRMSKEEVISSLGMQKHPEGGYFVETFRSSMQVSTSRGERSASTAILFLLGRGDRSHLHRIQSEEMWHFYGGEPLAVVELCKDSPEHFKLTVLGSDMLNGQKLQHVVPANTWFGSFPYREECHEYSLVGCTVAPGFEFADFELISETHNLSQQFPNAVDVIQKLTPVI
jgi:uncharacterized protein